MMQHREREEGSKGKRRLGVERPSERRGKKRGEFRLFATFRKAEGKGAMKESQTTSGADGRRRVQVCAYLAGATEE